MIGWSDILKEKAVSLRLSITLNC